MKKPTRLVDLNGEVISTPQGYCEALQWVMRVVESMEESQVDRADMQVVIAELFSEVRFYMRFVGKRQTNEL